MACSKCQEIGDLDCIKKHCWNAAGTSSKIVTGPTDPMATGPIMIEPNTDLSSFGPVVLGPGRMQSGVGLPSVFGDVRAVDPQPIDLSGKITGKLAGPQKVGATSDLPMTFSDFMKMDKYKGGTTKENVATVGSSMPGITSNSGYQESTLEAVALQQSLDNMLGKPVAGLTLQNPSLTGIPSVSIGPSSTGIGQSISVDLPALVDFNLNSMALPAAPKPARFGDVAPDLPAHDIGGIPLGGLQEPLSIQLPSGAGFPLDNIPMWNQGSSGFPMMDFAPGISGSSIDILDQTQIKTSSSQRHSVVGAPSPSVQVKSAGTNVGGGKVQVMAPQSTRTFSPPQGQIVQVRPQASAPAVFDSTFNLDGPAIAGQSSRKIRPSVSFGTSGIVIGGSETGNQRIRSDIINPVRHDPIFPNTGSIPGTWDTAQGTRIGQTGMGDVRRVAGPADPGPLAADLSGQMFEPPTTTFPTIEVETMSPRRKAELKEVSKMFLPKGSFRSRRN